MHGDIIYLELSLSRKMISETLSFYQTLFHWDIRESFLSSKKYYMFESPSKTLLGGFDENTKSSKNGALVYLDCDDIDKMIHLIESKFPFVIILKRKTLISSEYGSYALIVDPSGNRIGLQESPKGRKVS